MNKKLISIYTLDCPITFMPKYVGITQNTLNKRLSQHLITNHLNKKNSWIISLKEKGLKPIITLLDFSDEDRWVDDEKFYISYLRFLGFDLKNMTEGGEFIQMTDEIKDKIRLKITGIKRSDEFKQKIRKANLDGRIGRKGRKMSDEEKEKISKAHLGKKKSIEARLKMSESSKKMPVSQFTIDGVFIKTYKSISSLCREFNFSKGNIIKVCKNKIRKDGSKCKTAYGYIWKYA